MKNIRSLSIFVFVLIVVGIGLFYFGTLHEQKQTVFYFFPALAAFLSIFMLSMNLKFSKKNEKLLDEVHFLKQHSNLTEAELNEIQNEEKAENVVNYSVIIERIHSKINQNSIDEYFETMLSGLAKELNGVQAIAFLINKKQNLFNLAGKYAYYSEKKIEPVKLGEGVSGQVAKDKKMLILSNVPDGYIEVVSGLGSSTPKFLVIYPVLFENETIGLIEVATFEGFSKNLETLFDKLFEKLMPEITSYIKE
jgi:putative methionine-R-sulfoxide reductase with GAF domain